MKMYLTVVFWIMVFGFVVRVLEMAISKYPRVEERSLGFDIARIFVSIPFIIWVIYLKWWIVL